MPALSPSLRPLRLKVAQPLAQVKILPAALLGLGMLGAKPLAAQERSTPPAAPERTTDPAGSFAFILENDTFPGRDRFYSNGFLFAWRSPSYDPPAWLAAVTDRPSPIVPPAAEGFPPSGRHIQLCLGEA